MPKSFVFFSLVSAVVLGLWACSGEVSKTAVVEPPKTNVQIPQIVTQEQLLIRIHSVPYVYWEKRTNSREKLTVKSNQLPFPEIETTNWTALTNFEYSTNTYEKTLTQQVRLAPVYVSNRMTKTNWNTNKETQAVYNFYFTGPDTKKFEVTNWIRVYTNFPVTNQIVLVTNWLVETNFSVETNTRLVRVVLSNQRRFTTEVLVTTNFFLESNRVESISARTNWSRTADVRTNWVSVELILPKPPEVVVKEKRPTNLYLLILLIALTAGTVGFLIARRFHQRKEATLPPLLPYVPSRSLPPPTPVVAPVPVLSTVADAPKNLVQETLKEELKLSAAKNKLPSEKAKQAKKSTTKKPTARKPETKKMDSELKRWDAAMSKVARSLPKKKYQI